jgi:CO/xanthine dehydrogenase Mo-binding subunit
MTETNQDWTRAPNVNLRQIGRSLVRTDAPGKAQGRTRYAGDYVMPNMLHVKVLRATLASARLKRLDASKARALDGVACILTAAELPDRMAATDIPGQTGRKRLDTDQQILVRERVRYHGEPLALIAAETLRLAEQAADRGRAGAAARRLRSRRRPQTRRAPRSGQRQRGLHLQGAQGRYGGRFRRRRSYRREHLPHPVRRARLPRARSRPGLGR